jgi:hypothetical protein
VTGLSFGKLLPEITSQIKGLMHNSLRPAKNLNTGKIDSFRATKILTSS